MTISRNGRCLTPGFFTSVDVEFILASGETDPVFADGKDFKAEVREVPGGSVLIGTLETTDDGLEVLGEGSIMRLNFPAAFLTAWAATASQDVVVLDIVNTTDNVHTGISMTIPVLRSVTAPPAP